MAGLKVNNLLFMVIVLCFSKVSISQTILPLSHWVVQPIDNRKILSNTSLSYGEKEGKIRVYSAKNEYEAASFVIKSNEVLDNLGINISTLTSGANTINPELIDIKLIKEWYQGDDAWVGRYNKNKEKHLVPELMLNNDGLVKVDYVSKKNFLRITKNGKEKLVDITEPAFQTGAINLDVKDFDVRDSDTLQNFSLNRNLNKQIWLTVSPTHVESGLYIGKLTITDNKHRLKIIPIEIYIRDFNLCEPNIEYSMYYRGQLSPEKNTISSDIKNEIQLENELIDLRNHGVLNPTIYQSTADPKNLDLYLSIREKIGLSNDTLYYLGIKTGRKKNIYSFNKLKSKINRIREVLNKHDVKNLYIYGVDEARGEVLTSQLELWRRLKREEGVRIFVAGYSGAFEAVGKDLDLLIHARALDSSIPSKFHSLGNKVFSYNNPQVGAENPLIYRENYGLSLWKAGYDGAMNYAYMASFGTIWNDFDHKYFRDHNFSYPTTNGVINTIAWEGFREGVDDVRYISTLEKAGSNMKLDESLKDAINNYLIDLKKNDEFDFISVREKISDFIVRARGGC